MKTQRINIQRLGYRFSVDFYIHTLGYGFLFGNHIELARVSRFWFADFFLEIFKIHRLVPMDFPMDFWLF
jgi:hypothetical protein